jgi:hypothetical protein
MNKPLVQGGWLFFLQKAGIGLLIALIVWFQGGMIVPRANVRVKSVHFNVTNEQDKSMLQAIGKRNFSKYVKELIQEDMKKNGLPEQPIQRGGVKYLPKQT